MWKPVPRHEPNNAGIMDDKALQLFAGGGINGKLERAGTYTSLHLVKTPNDPHVFELGGGAGPPSRGKLSFFRRVGKRASILVVPCILTVAAAIGFVGWLWFGDRSEPRWRRLMLAGWSNQAVTISSLVMRSALSILGGIATSMIAAVALEQSGSSLRDAVSLSMARFSSPGPNSFWFETFFRQHFVALPLRLILCLLILSTLAVQFASTILLSDLGMGRVTGFSHFTKNMTGYVWSQADFGPGTSDGNFTWHADFRAHHAPFQSQQEYWSGLPRTFNLFAEYSEPGFTDGAVDDTGPTLRSFLPINDQNIRHNLKSYTGLATVFDARVVCVRPQVISGSVNPNTINLSVSVPSVSHIIPTLTTSDREIKVKLPRQRTFGEGWHIQPLDISVGGIVSSLDPASLQDLNLSYKSYQDDELDRPSRYWDRVSPPGAWRTVNDEHNCGVDLDNAYLLMDTKDHNPGAVESGTKYVISEFPEGNWGAWHGTKVGIAPEDVAGRPPYAEWSLGSVTVCFDSLPKGAQYHQIQVFEITASGNGEQSEPRTTSRSASDPLDIVALRQQLGASSTRQEDLISRNILKLDSLASIRDEMRRSSEQWKYYCAVSSEIEALEPVQPDLQWNPTIYNRSTYLWLTQMAFNVENPIALCTGECRESGLRSSTAYAVMLGEIIRGSEFGSPAVALQAVLTQILREVYYNWIIRFDEETEVEMVPSVAVQIPLQYRGFWAVVGIVSLHLLLCFIACVTFATLTETSCLNNGWQAVSEIASNSEGRRVIDQVGQMRDTEVEKWLNGEENIYRRFVVGKGGYKRKSETNVISEAWVARPFIMHTAVRATSSTKRSIPNLMKRRTAGIA
ncbi:hypothetical protein HJFPF1_13177 [Paramyrothecium foliicola]|nr:hypothetical protein HJFPF1_13177 [Paramyrothecium foliicola]